jgi:transposase
MPWACQENRHTFLFEILVIDWLLATKNQDYKFGQVLRLNTSVGSVWGLKESFKSLFECKDYQEAINRFSDWNSFVIWEAIPELTKVAKMFSNHIKGVCYVFVESVSNTMAERLNGKIQIIKTIGKEV